jgi:hypothetical protein
METFIKPDSNTRINLLDLSYLGSRRRQASTNPKHDSDQICRRRGDESFGPALLTSCPTTKLGNPPKILCAGQKQSRHGERNSRQIQPDDPVERPALIAVMVIEVAAHVETLRRRGMAPRKRGRTGGRGIISQRYPMKRTLRPDVFTHGGRNRAPSRAGR